MHFQIYLFTFSHFSLGSNIANSLMLITLAELMHLLAVCNETNDEFNFTIKLLILRTVVSRQMKAEFSSSVMAIKIKNEVQMKETWIALNRRK